ncbi:MAG: phosphoglycerate dehydrogenase [Clostridia bacterium]|nr:phosphoglycerate dehydrogenase [Clostridia bacterium]
MLKIKTLNAISPVYRNILDGARYLVSAEAEAPDAIIVRSADMHGMPVDASLLAVGRAGVGVNNIPLDELAQKGVVVFNSPGANANAVKELVVAALLMASRRVSEGIQWTLDNKDDPDIANLVEKGKKQFVGPELAGKTLGVIGLGAIGVMVANTGASLGMKVLGYDPYISVEHAWSLSRSVKHSTDLSEVLKTSDYITLHVPLTDGTRKLLDAAAIEQMKPGAAIINYARDALVDAEAVREALEIGQLRAYVSDFPVPGLVGCRNTVFTPHLGASTPESEDNCVRIVAEELDDYLVRGAIRNSVNYPACDPGRLTMPRVTVLHQNVPNVIGSVTGALAAAGLNIENMVNQSRGAYAYTVLDLSDKPSPDVVAELGRLEAVYRVRLLTP